MEWRTFLLVLLMCSVIQAVKKHANQHARHARDASEGLSQVGVQWDGSINSTSVGYITSPNYPGPYPNNAAVKWRIYAPLNKWIKLTFHNFRLQLHGSCGNDSLSIHNGTSMSSPIISKLCGYNRPWRPILVSNPILVMFESDETITDRGFMMRYEFVDVNNQATSTPIHRTTTNYPTSSTSPRPTAECGLILTTPGEIDYPRHSGNYENNAHCTWLISAPLGQWINLTFQEFRIESQDSCDYDSLSIYNGSSMSSPLIAKLCGNNPSRSLILPNSIFVIFRSDGSFTDSGFRMRYESTSTRPTAECRHHLTTPGEIDYPPYGGNYNNNAHCTWLISAPLGQIIMLHFISFELEYQSNCNYDRLQINDAYAADVYYCGSLMSPYFRSPPSTYVSGGRSLNLTFYSDHSVVRSGFKVEFTSGTNFTTTTGSPTPQPSTTSRTSPPPSASTTSYRNGTTSPHPTAECGRVWNTSGEIKYPAHDGYYSNYAHCSWLLRAPTGQIIRIRFMNFSLEGPSPGCPYDKVQIHEDGYGRTSCGNGRPLDYTSHSKNLRITFVSDPSITGPGFRLEFFFGTNFATPESHVAHTAGSPTTQPSTASPTSYTSTGFATQTSTATTNSSTEDPSSVPLPEV